MKYTINDIAKMAGVSKSTVSRVINHKREGASEATRKRILDLIEELNYAPNLNARSIVTSSTKTIGLVLSDVTNPFFPIIITEIQSFMMDRGYTVLVCIPNADLQREAKFINVLAEKRVDGIILSPCSRKQEDYLNILNKYEIPVVLLDHNIPNLEISGVFVNNIQGGYLATKHLIQRGCRRIVFLGGSLQYQTTIDRFKGYQKALREYGMQVDKKLLSFSQYTWKDGILETQDFLNREIKFDAIFAGCDIMAIGAMKALRKRQIKIPDAVKIVGYDDITVSELQDPSLTTVRQPAKAMARHASSMMISTIERRQNVPNE